MRVSRQHLADVGLSSKLLIGGEVTPTASHDFKDMN